MDMPVMDMRPLTLEGRHVRLEPLSLDHFDGLAQALDSTLLQWFSKPASNAAELREFIEEALDEQRRGRSLPFATIDRANDVARGHKDSVLINS